MLDALVVSQHTNSIPQAKLLNFIKSFESEKYATLVAFHRQNFPADTMFDSCIYERKKINTLRNFLHANIKISDIHKFKFVTNAVENNSAPHGL